MKRFFLMSLLCTLCAMGCSEAYAMPNTANECSTKMQEPDYVVQKCHEYWDRAVSLVEAGKEIEALEVMTEMRAWGHSLDEAGKQLFNNTLVGLLNGDVTTQISSARKQAIEEHLHSYKTRLKDVQNSNNPITYRTIRLELQKWISELRSDAEMAYAATVFQEMMNEIATK